MTEFTWCRGGSSSGLLCDDYSINMQILSNCGAINAVLPPSPYRMERLVIFPTQSPQLLSTVTSHSHTLTQTANPCYDAFAISS
jgi:hypothetical protein